MPGFELPVGPQSAVNRDLADRIGRLTLKLCRIPSATGNEGELADFVVNEIRDREGLIHRVGHTVIVTRNGVAGKPTFGLFGHLDTVAPSANQTIAMLDGRVYGCGASDMKGGLALMLELLSLPCEVGLVLVFYDREEGPYSENGLQLILATPGLLPHVDVALALEPTNNEIQAGCLGGLHAIVTFRGRRAHSARPWQGENAIYKATGLINRLANLERVAVEVGGLTFYEVMTVTTAHSEGNRNVVPERFQLNLNYRFAPGKSIATAKRDLASKIMPEVESDVSIDIVDEAPAGDVFHNHPLFADWTMKNKLPTSPKQAWTDVAQLTARGIAAVNFGPGDPSLAHQAEEYISIPALVHGYELLADLILGLNSRRSITADPAGSPSRNNP